MKKLIFLVVFAQTAQCYSKDNVFIHGNIRRQLADSLKISYTLASIKYSPSEYKVRLDHGNFKAGLEIPEGYTLITLTNGDEQTVLFAAPGADLELTVDAHNFDSTLHYSGKGKEVANFMAKCVLEKHKPYDFAVNGDKQIGLAPREFESALQKQLQQETDYIKTNGSDLPESFKNFMKLYYQYDIYYTMHKYPSMHEIYRQKTMHPKDIPAENYTVTDDVPLAFDDEYLNIPTYRSYLTNVIGSRTSAQYARDHLTFGGHVYADSVLAGSYRLMPPLTAEYSIGSKIYLSVEKSPIELAEKNLAEYKAHFPASKNIPILEKAISEKKKIGPGKPEIDFDIVTPEGNKMKLSDLKGNVVYMDFWSRGCVPCLSEMGEAKKIRDHFKDKPVSFVYVSLDENDSVWRTAIKQFSIDGVNTHVENGWDSDIIKNYGVSSMPSYFLIDKNGKFANVDVVERAGNPEKLIAQIENILK